MLPGNNPAQIPSENPAFGRCPIYTDEDYISSSNVVQVLSNAYSIHQMNASRIDALWNYYKGNQPILSREKTIRPEINNKIVENRFYQIVSFHTGYFLGEPMQYISRNSEDNADEIIRLNDFMAYQDKASKDKDLSDWMHICGTGYRIVQANPMNDADEPVLVDVPDPRYTFVVYSSKLGHKPMMGVQYVIKTDGDTIYSCWTEDALYTIEDGRVVKSEYHDYGAVPVIEYPLNRSRTGAAEIVLPLLDALNELDSDRLDGVDQFVQSFIKFINCDIDEQSFTAMKQMGAIKVKTLAQGMPADVQIVTSELNQQQTQTLKDDLYKAILDICGMPAQGDGSNSDSSNNGAVVLKNGWQGAETRAKATQLMFKRSERMFLRIALRICRDTVGMRLKANAVEMAFTRRNYSDLLTKSQVLTTMLATDKIHPELAFAHCGLFVDPEAAYKKSSEYYEERMKEIEEAALIAESVSDRGSDAPANGGNSGESV